MKVNRRMFPRRSRPERATVVTGPIEQCDLVGKEARNLLTAISRNKVSLQQMIPSMGLVNSSFFATHMLRHSELMSAKEFKSILGRINSILESRTAHLASVEAREDSFGFLDQFEYLEHDSHVYGDTGRMTQPIFDGLFQLFSEIARVSQNRKSEIIGTVRRELDEFKLNFESVWLNHSEFIREEQLHWVKSADASWGLSSMGFVEAFWSEKNINGEFGDSSPDDRKKRFFQRVFGGLDVSHLDFSLRTWDIVFADESSNRLTLLNRVNGQQMHFFFYNEEPSKSQLDYEHIQQIFRTSDEIETLIIDKSPLAQKTKDNVSFGDIEDPTEQTQFTRDFQQLFLKHRFKGPELQKYFDKFVLRNRLGRLRHSRVYERLFDRLESFDFGASVEYSFLRDNSHEFEPEIIVTGLSSVEEQSLFLRSFPQSAMKRFLEKWNFSLLLENYDFFKKCQTEKCARCGGSTLFPRGFMELMDGESGFSSHKATLISVASALQELVLGFEKNSFVCLSSTIKVDFFRAFFYKLAQMDTQLAAFYQEVEQIRRHSQPDVIVPGRRGAKFADSHVSHVTVKYPLVRALLDWERASFVYYKVLPHTLYEDEQKYDFLDKLAMAQTVFTGDPEHLFRFNLSVARLPTSEFKYFEERVQYFQKMLSVSTFLKAPTLTTSE